MKSGPARPKPQQADDLKAVVNSLRHLVRAIRVSSHAAETGLGITGAQLFVLQVLAGQPGASLREVAALTLTDQSSVSVVVSRLVEAKLVQRRADAHDGRQLSLTLTAAGRALLRHAPPLAHTRLVSALQKVSPAQLRTVRRVVEQVARELGSGTEPPEMFFEGTKS